MRIPALIVLAVVSAVGPARDARAGGDDDATAATHAEAGKQAFAAERFAEAIAEFRAANAIKPDPKLVYAIAQAQRMAGDCATAIVSYKEFLATRPDPKLAEYSQANIDRCEKVLAKPPKPKPEPKVEPKVEPKPDPAPVVLPHPIDPWPRPLPVVPERRDTGRSWTSDWVGHGLVVGGLAAASVGTVLWIKGRGAARDVNAATDHASFLEARDAAASALTYQRVGIGVALAGGALIAGGVIHYVVGGSARETRISAIPLHGGAAVVAGGSF